MISVSDIVKLLDQVPIWKTLKGLPQRLAELEQRVAELEAAKALPQVSPGQPCPSCGAHALRRTSSELTRGPLSHTGMRDEAWTCEACGEKDERISVK